MKKVIVTGGPFTGFVGELIDESVNVEIFGRLCDIGRPAYVVQSKQSKHNNPIITNDRVILEIRHAKHGFYA